MATTLTAPTQLPILLPSRSVLSMSTAPRPRPATKRHQSGHERFTALAAYWVKRNDISLRQLAAIIDWGLGESGWLGSGPLSQLTRGVGQRTSLKTLDAVAAANTAIYAWQTHGPEAAIAQYGPLAPWGVKPHWLDQAFWLPCPDHPAEPMELQDLALVLAGRLEVPYLPLTLAPSEGRVMSRELSALLNDLAVSRGLAPRAASEAFLAAYPGTRPELIRDLLLGEADLSSDEMVEELAPLAEMIRILRRLPQGELGPSELRAELLAARRAT